MIFRAAFFAIVLMLAASFLPLTLSAQGQGPGFEHQRENGVSIYLTPEHIVELIQQPDEQRFMAKYFGEDAIRDSAATAEELFRNMESEKDRLRTHGAWIVLTHPDSYSETDLAEFDKLKTLMKDEGIPVYETRASEMPHGWKRI